MLIVFLQIINGDILPFLKLLLFILLKKYDSIQLFMFQFSVTSNTPHTVYVGCFFIRLMLGLKRCVWCVLANHQWRYTLFSEILVYFIKKIRSIQFILFQFSVTCNTPHTVYVGWFFIRLMLGLGRCVDCVSANHQWRYPIMFLHVVLISL